MGTPRDYYADLELPPTADVTEIRKQYRKLGIYTQSSFIYTSANLNQLSSIIPIATLDESKK